MLIQCIYVLVSLSVALNTASSYTTMDTMEKRSPTQHYCGSVMAEALKVICDSVYNPMFTNKRSKTRQTSFSIAPPRRENIVKPSDMDAFAAAIQNLQYPFASKATSLTMLSRNGNYVRDKRGVYDECCIKSCSLNELATYCGQ